MGEEDMSIPTKLIISLAAALGGGITKKYYTDQETTKLSGGFWFNAVSCLTAAAVLLCWGGFGSASAYTVLLGIVFGAITADNQPLNRTFQHGKPVFRGSLKGVKA